MADIFFEREDQPGGRLPERESERARLDYTQQRRRGRGKKKK